MSMAYKCDRCGEFYQDDAKESISIEEMSINLGRPMGVDVHTEAVREVDLCPTCSLPILKHLAKICGPYSVE